MHYQHAYHAGNFADVLKHVVLVALLEAQSRRDKPWCCMDTHAGAGLYDLSADAGEWKQGIGCLWDRATENPLLERYLALVHEAAGKAALPRRYPGSPWLAAQLVRGGDRVVAVESVARVATALRRNVPQAEVQQRNGYELASQMPPRERRGVVLVDPPFERADEFDAARRFVTKAAPRYPGGVFALWYPLKNTHAADHALRCLARDTRQEIMNLQLDAGSNGDGRMHACGIAILRPPYRVDEVLHPALTELARILNPRACFSSRVVMPA